MKKAVMVFGALCFLVSAGLFLVLKLKIRGGDWAYFDGLALVLRSSLLSYKTFPLHDPFACSGISILSNPQNWIFSPLFLLTLLFPPTLGNILSIVLMKFVGMIGAWRYFEHLKVSRPVAFLGAILFANLNWFNLHFVDGHVVFRTFYLLPWVFFYFETLRDRKSLLALGGLYAFMILDGGIYPAVFSLMYLVLSLPFHWKELATFLRREWKFFLLALGGYLLLIMPKVYPVMLYSGRMKMVQELHDLPLSLFLTIFFDPFKDSTFMVQKPYRFHEYGAYVGVAFSLLFLVALVRTRPNRGELVRLFLAGVFLWICTGWGGAFNPYNLLAQLPIINNTHLQVRYAVIFIFVLLTVTLQLAERLPWKGVVLGLLTLANLETLVANYNSYHGAGQAYELPLMTRSKWLETKRFVLTPNLYYADGIISRACYEPSRPPGRTWSSDEKTYRGEAKLLSGDVKPSLPMLTPGEVRFEYESAMGGVLLLNLNYLDGWIETNVGGETFEQDSLLGVRLPPGKGIVVLEYLPSYFPWVMLASLIGLLVLIGAFRSCRGSSDPAPAA